MARIARRVAYLPMVLMMISAMSGFAKADTVYPTSDACWQATHLPCSHTDEGWVPAGMVDPSQGVVTPMPEDPVMKEHQLKAMEVGVSGTATNPVVAVDMNQVTFPDAQPYLDTEVNRVRVPIRLVSEQMGAKVEWLQETQTVVITRQGLTIQLRVNGATAMVNERIIQLDAAPKLVRPGRVMVPLRFISEALGATVDWVGAQPPAGQAGLWGEYQVWIWVPWGFWETFSIHDRLEVYHWWYHH